MDNFLHDKNLELLRRRLAGSDPTKNPERHNMLLRLLAEEEAKEAGKDLRTAQAGGRRPI